MPSLPLLQKCPKSSSGLKACELNSMAGRKWSEGEAHHRKVDLWDTKINLTSCENNQLLEFYYERISNQITSIWHFHKTTRMLSAHSAARLRPFGAPTGGHHRLARGVRSLSSHALQIVIQENWFSVKNSVPKILGLGRSQNSFISND